MNASGRAAYKNELITILDQIPELENSFSDEGRLARIKACINNVIRDIETIEAAAPCC